MPSYMPGQSDAHRLTTFLDCVEGPAARSRSAMANEPEDTLRKFADALRSKGGVENRSAVLGGERYELFRGKDLVRWVKANPDKSAAAAPGKVAEPEELAKFLGTLLLRRPLAARVDRVNKKPVPGSKKLVKFPRKIAPMPADQAAVFVEDGFYVWRYERPTSPWLYVWAALIPVAVLLACLFPLAPNWAKLAVFYLSSGLLMLLLGALLLRSSLALASWIATGSTLWLLPNIMSEEVPITQILKPLVSVQRPAEGASKWGNHLLTRLAVAAAMGGLLFVLYQHSPDKASMATEASRYRDDLMDFFGVQREGQQRLAGNATAAANATEAANATAADGGAAGFAAEAAGDAAADDAAETVEAKAAEAEAAEQQAAKQRAAEAESAHADAGPDGEL